ncbi:MAG: hypothetical protein OXJ64_17310, partial [Boseongicola sp.]|nr:hypothetical protein [Boseongicola sp.]
MAERRIPSYQTPSPGSIPIPTGSIGPRGGLLSHADSIIGGIEAVGKELEVAQTKAFETQYLQLDGDVRQQMMEAYRAFPDNPAEAEKQLTAAMSGNVEVIREEFGDRFAMEAQKRWGNFSQSLMLRVSDRFIAKADRENQEAWAAKMRRNQDDSEDLGSDLFSDNPAQAIAAAQGMTTMMADVSGSGRPEGEIDSVTDDMWGRAYSSAYMALIRRRMSGGESLETILSEIEDGSMVGRGVEEGSDERPEVRMSDVLNQEQQDELRRRVWGWANQNYAAQQRAENIAERDRRVRLERSAEAMTLAVNAGEAGWDDLTLALENQEIDLPTYNRLLGKIDTPDELGWSQESQNEAEVQVARMIDMGANPYAIDAFLSDRVQMGLVKQAKVEQIREDIFGEIDDAERDARRRLFRVTGAENPFEFGTDGRFRQDRYMERLRVELRNRRSAIEQNAQLPADQQIEVPEVNEIATRLATEFEGELGMYESGIEAELQQFLVMIPGEETPDFYATRKNLHEAFRSGRITEQRALDMSQALG